MKMKRIINRLVCWLRAAGLTPSQITDCIDYITKKSAAGNKPAASQQKSTERLPAV